MAALDEVVLKGGGEKLGAKEFTDTYFDTSGCLLTRQDVWLRQWDGEWELKVPAGGGAVTRSGGERTVFREVEGEDAVLDALLESQPSLAKVAKPGTTLPALLEAAGLTSFASFSTARACYKFSSTKIDADVASFGHAVLEIEVMVHDKSEIDQAEAEIQRVAELIGAQPMSKGAGGKLETYIRRYCPDVYASLVDAKILAPPTQDQ